MSFDLLDSYSRKENADFPPRTLPIGFMLRLAKALHSYGMTAYELESAMKKVGEKLGFSIQCLSQPTNIIMSFSHPQEPEPKTYIFRVEPGQVDLDRQIQTDQVVQQVIDGDISVESGAQTLKEIGRSQYRYGNPCIVAAYGLISAAIARVLGGAMGEILVALFIGLLTGLIAIICLRFESVKFLFPTLAAMLAALAASVAVYFDLLGSPYIATLSGVIVLVPGLLLTTAIAELAHQNMVSGTARLFSAATIFLQIGFGVAIGNSIGSTLVPVAELHSSWLLSDWTQWLAILVATTGLFFLFHGRAKDFFWMLAGGLIAYSATKFGTQYLGSVMGAFVGAFSVGLASNLFERITKITRSVMQMPGIILLVPGSVGFQSLSLLVEDNIIAGLETAFKMSFVTIALVTGLLLASLIIPQKTYQ